MPLHPKAEVSGRALGAFGVQYQLCLGHYSAQSPVFGAHCRLPDHRGPSPVKGRRFARHGRSDRSRSDELRRGLDSGRTLVGIQVQDGTDRAQRIGKRHQAAAVDDVADRAQVSPDFHGGHDLLGAGLDESDTKKSRQKWSQQLLES